MSACDHFTQNAWRPDLCSSCQKAKSEHDPSSGPRASWRRKSEPNPNNIITTGVRISALASKFQTRDVRTASSQDTEAERARTLDRKIRRNKELRVCSSRSTELLNLSFTSSLSSSSSSTTTSAISSSSHSSRSSESPQGERTQDLKSRNITANTGALSQPSPVATSSSSRAHASTVSGAERTTSLPAGTSKQKLNSSATSSGHGTARAPAPTSSSGVGGLRKGVSSTSATTSTFIKANSVQQSRAEPTKKLTVSQSLVKHSSSSSSSTSSSVLKSQHVDNQNKTQARDEKVVLPKEKRKVSIPDLKPEVIGHDGGLGNMFTEEEEAALADGDENIYLSLTDEEKQFALLALGNTVWNSDTRNLQVEPEAAKRVCREFEDLSVDQLWSCERFKSLVTSDPVRKSQDFGTFPKLNSSKQARTSVKNLNLAPEGRKVYGEHSHKNGATAGGGGGGGQRPLRVNSRGGNHEVNRHDSQGSVRPGSSCSTAGCTSEVNVSQTSDIKEQLKSNIATDITDSLHTTTDYLNGEQSDIKTVAQKIEGINSQSVDTQQNHHTKEIVEAVSRLTGDHEVHMNDLNISVTDSLVQDELQAVAILNDVLRDYEDKNESSTDDLTVREDTSLRHEAPHPGTKVSDFEARMASVAATLDLTKQQQRGKRPAPRPPVSPPPEPNVADAVSPKKVVHQPEPIFKMVTVGKSIVTLPPQQDVPSPTSSRPAIIFYGLDELSLCEPADNTNGRTNGDGKNKKGITSFFRNILKRGKESTESFESVNPDVQLSAKMDRKDVTGSIVVTEENSSSSSADQKVIPKLSPQSQFVVVPPSSPSYKNEDTTGMLSKAAGDGGVMSESGKTSAAAGAAPTSPVKASPPVQRKASKGLPSPKMMLKRATTRCSPPATHHSKKAKEKEPDLIPSVKPYPAPKPSVVSSGSDIPPLLTAEATQETIKDKESNVLTSHTVRHRPKSPKHTAPPVPPTRSSAGLGKVGSSDSRNVDLTKELESRLKKSNTEQSGGGTLSRSELRESTRRSMPVPPSPPGERKLTGSPPVSPIKETLNSLPCSPSSPTGTSFDFPSTEWSGGSTSTIDDDLPKFSEKIELPTVATQARKGFLGKLGGNRKSRAPQPPSVKRTKSITQSATLPRGDKKSKKINAADISGPVMVTDVTNSLVLENRRNTISLGDEPAFVSLSASCIHLGGTTSSASVDKSSFDEFAFPCLSPLGSLENLYEAILPKTEGNLFHFYDPPTSSKVLCPNIPSDGYLEPVPPLSSKAAASLATSSSPSAASLVVVTTSPNLSSSSSSSATNTSVVKPLLQLPASSLLTNSGTLTIKELGSAQRTHSTPGSSDEANSGGSSGSTLSDSSRQNSDTFVSKIESSSSISTLCGLGSSFVEPEMTEQRRALLASQPIYEEIPNGGNDDVTDDELDKEVVTEKVTSKVGVSGQVVLLPGTTQVSKAQMAQAWLQQSQAAAAPPSASSCALLPSSSTNTSTLGVSPSSPSHCKQNQAQSSINLLMTSSQIMSSSLMTSSLMTTSLTSSMLPPPPPPPPTQTASHPQANGSANHETVSSESDSQSNCSYDTQSNCSNFSRPRPVPRRKPKRPDTGGSDQYVSMNKLTAQVSLSEERLRDVFTKLTSITFHALQDIYTQCERILSLNKLDIPNTKTLKWADFDIYGQPIHTSGRCVVYNAKLQVSNSPCQLMILHSRPATETSTTNHPSLLKPSAVFADTIPFSYLTPDFIKTSQLLQNSVYDSSQARCFVAVGSFDIIESLDSHLTLLRETLSQDFKAYLNVILAAALQLLSAMSHCLDQGFSVTETDYNDVFLITRSDLHGKVVAFLPHQRSLDMPQGEAMCNFLGRLFSDNMSDDDEEDIDNNSSDDDDEDKIVSAPRKVISRLQSLLESRRVECLGQVRTAVEYLLWGPDSSELSLTSSEGKDKGTGVCGASREQELYVWLEKERLAAVGRLARNVPGLGAGISLEEFYTLKFLLKSSAGSLSESHRQLSC